MAITTAELILQVRERLDLKYDADFVTDSEITRYANRSRKRLFLKVILADEDYFVKTVDQSALTITSGVIALPADFYKLIGIGWRNGTGRFRPLIKASFQDLEKWEQSKGQTGRAVAYVSTSTEITLLPEQPAVFVDELRFRYVNLPAVFNVQTPDASVTDLLVGEEDWVVADVCVQIGDKEERDVRVLQDERDVYWDIVLESLQPRDVGDPQRARKRQDAYFQDPNDLAWLDDFV